MTSKIDKLKHFYVEDYSGIYFTDELNAGEEFLYTLAKVIRESNICKHAIKELKLAGILGLSKKLWKKYTEAIYKYRTNTGKMTTSDYTHLFGYLNPYYRSAYNIPKRRK